MNAVKTIKSGAMPSMKSEALFANTLTLDKTPATTLHKLSTTANAQHAFVTTDNQAVFIYWDSRSSEQYGARESLCSKTKWVNREYRHAYMEASIEQGVAWQIKLNREGRGLSQTELARLIGSKQSAISRAEDPTYGRHRIETLVKIAHTFDCALQVKFIPYSALAMDSEDLSIAVQYVQSYSEEIES